MLKSANSPPWLRRGGRDLKKNVAKHPCWERTGWFVQLPIIGGLNKPPRLREAKVASRNFLDRAATPPYPRRGISALARIGLFVVAALMTTTLHAETGRDAWLRYV